uniref:hypothetical protein n=1 Tax=Flavobacterium sp. TaxID=239 RepID=UPI004048F0F7
MQNRVDIKDFILKIEHDFPVNNWKVDDVHLWPILRIRLFFYLIDKIENQQKTNNSTSSIKIKKAFIQKVKAKLKSYFYVWYYFYWKLKLPKKEYIFVGSDSHRVNYRNKRFNRYFDILIEKENIVSQSLYFEYASDLKNQYNEELIYKFSKALKGFLNFKKRIKCKNKSFSGYSNFLSFLNKNEIFNDFVIKNKELQLITWYENQFGLKIKFFKKVVKKIAPKKIAVLCYYSEDIYALIAAANQLSIQTIEMQHGPQTSIHLSYGSWSCVPNEGYDVLPRKFWCWDNYSKDVLEKWTAKSELYTVEVIGNPWIEYWKNNKKTYFEKDFILYSLQPKPITLEQLFTPEIIKLIKTTSIKWFIRLHPRQLNEMNAIKQLLKKEQLLDLVDIDNATNDALPQLLANAKLHITHSSGSALEASYFGLKTILINEIGIKSFPHLIETNEAVYIDYEDTDFYDKTIKIVMDDK